MDRQFPILAYGHRKGASVPWEFVAPHEQQALRNHDQTLERLAERGGLSWSEVEHVVLNKPWDGTMFMLPREKDRYLANEAAAKARVERLLDEWRSSQKAAQ